MTGDQVRQDPQPSTSASSLTPGPVIARPLPRFQRGNEKEEATTRRWIFSEIDRERFTPAELVTRAGHPAGRSSLLSFHIFPPPSAARFFRKGARSISTRRKRITNFWTIFGRGFESRIEGRRVLVHFYREIRNCPSAFFRYFSASLWWRDFLIFSNKIILNNCLLKCLNNIHSWPIIIDSFRT